MKLLWPGRYNLYDLMVHRATVGEAAFESEHQNNPHDPSLAEWPAEYFDWPGIWFDKWPVGLACRTLAIDPSKGKNDKSGDPSAIVRLGVAWSGVEYVEADIRLRTVDAICGDAVEHVKAFSPDALYLEPVAFQELMAAPLREAMKAARVECPIDLTEDNTNKDVRIRRLTEVLCQRKIRFKSRSPGTLTLLNQMKVFPNGDHDDGPDALEMARRLAMKWLRKGKRQ